MIVVDTNVMVRFVMVEEAAVDVVRLRERDREWAAPSILVSELRNALLGYVRRGDLTSEQAKAMHDEAAIALGGRVYEAPGDVVLDTALECGLTAYDAEFVTLARALGVGLVTMDAAVLRGAPDVAVPLEAFA